MGCKQSDLRRGNSEATDADRPPVPEGCWYAHPFNEPSHMKVTPFHEQMRGIVVFSKQPIPASAAEVESLPGGTPLTIPSGSAVDLATGELFGMAYLYDTALLTEHTWRLRVASVDGLVRTQRPFYDTLIGVRLIIDGIMVPDVAPHKESIPDCTATLRQPDALAQWRLVPLVFLPNPVHATHSVIRLWDGLIFSFADYCQRLTPGAHTMIAEIVYGNKKEQFCSGVLASGECLLVASRDCAARLSQLAKSLYSNVRQGGRELSYVSIKGSEAELRCEKCSRRLQFYCCKCGAQVCGSNACVFEIRSGYPVACEAHPPPASTSAV